MKSKKTPEWLPQGIVRLHEDIGTSWGKGWRTDLLERLMHPSTKSAWKEIAKRDEPKSNPDRFITSYALCWEIMDTAEASNKKHLSRSEARAQSVQIVDSATQIANLIENTDLDRIADRHFTPKAGAGTPILSSILRELADTARDKANLSSSEKKILPLPNSKNAQRIYVIRRLATFLKHFYGSPMRNTLAILAGCALDEHVTEDQVNTALQNWKPVDFNNRGEYS